MSEFLSEYLESLESHTECELFRGKSDAYKKGFRDATWFALESIYGLDTEALQGIMKDVFGDPLN